MSMIHSRFCNFRPPDKPFPGVCALTSNSCSNGGLSFIQDETAIGHAHREKRLEVLRLAECKRVKNWIKEVGVGDE
jgi:hypothetical protein